MYANPRLDRKPEMLSKRGGAHYSRAALDVASSIIKNRRDVQIVNVQNNGTIRDFYDDAVIEVPCAVGANGARPVKIGFIEPHILGLMHLVKAYERLSIEAAITRSYDTALTALLTHPLGGGAEKAPKVLADLNKAHKLGLN
jgi:6-phospho-beta-glucosidase